MTVFKYLLTLATTFALAQSTVLAQGSVRDYRRTHEHEILSEFIELLALPNVASDRENIRRNAAAIVTMMQRRKLAPQLLETSDPSMVNGKPLVRRARSFFMRTTTANQPIRASGPELCPGNLLFAVPRWRRAERFCPRQKQLRP
jgi:hypothetical protein